MTLFSSPRHVDSHRVRFALAEKDVLADIIDVGGQALPENLLDLNPYHSVPTLVDRDLVLYDSRLVIEYLDERFPHPPLMPVDPIGRARFKLAMYRMERDWYPLIQDIEGADGSKARQARQILHDSLLANLESFRGELYFQSAELSLIDVTLAPILWRLPAWGIFLSETAEPVRRYERRIFSRPAFRQSLSTVERALRV